MAKRRSALSRWVSQADLILFISLLIVFFCAPLPLGSDRGWAYLALTGLCLILLASYLTIHFIKDCFNSAVYPSLKTDPAIYLILGLGIWFFIQASLPIPLSLLATIAPVTHDIYATAYNGLNIADLKSTAVISLDKGQTYNKALLTLACFSVVYLMGKLINTPQRLKMFCYVIVYSGVFQAVFGVLMTLTGKEYLFFTPKTSYIGHATGTFVNRNSLAGYIEMTLSVGVGALLAIRKASVKNAYHWRGILQLVIETLLSQVALLRGLLIAMVIGLLMTHSRMGNAAFFNALLLTGTIAALSSTHFRKKGFYLLLISIVLVDIFLIGTLFDLDVVINRIENTVASKEDRDEVVRSAMHMIPDFWLTGSGAGTFAYIFPFYKQQFIPGLYDLAHNDYLQIFLEAGILGTSLLLIYLLFAIIRSLKLLRNGENRLSRSIGFAVLMAVLSLLIHSAVDFNLQIPANILLFVAVLTLPWVALNMTLPVKHD